jgi:hypothetical protein
MSTQPCPDELGNHVPEYLYWGKIEAPQPQPDNGEEGSCRHNPSRLFQICSFLSASARFVCRYCEWYKELVP